MSKKTFIPEGQKEPASHIGATLEALAATISARQNFGGKSYTKDLLSGDETVLLGKVTEEAAEVVDAAQEGDIDHLRYEAADVVYHLLVVLERYGIPLDEFAAELNMRMKETERPEGAVRLLDGFVNRGK